MRFIRLLFFLFTILYSSFSFSQNDSCSLRISLLTCTPGEELYSTFGHSALRVIDTSTGTDIIYNYGTFDFNDPQFYTKFVKGKLLYYLNQESFEDFRYGYVLENRGIEEQLLNLDCEEKKNIQQALYINLQGENRYYRYDFLFDNCTTRLRDLIARNGKDSVMFGNILPKDGASFRNLIHFYLDRGGMYWSKLGIDMLLGSKIDRAMTNSEVMFLPDFLLKGFDSARIGKRNLVAEKKDVFAAQPNGASAKHWFTPAVFAWGLLVLFVLLNFINTGWAKKLMVGFDFILFFTAGLIGLLIVFMWTGTDHIVCSNNYNLLWALPAHVVTAFFIRSKKKWIKKYFLFTTILYLLLLIGWKLLPQELNTALIPVTILMCRRSWKIQKM